MQVVHLGRDCKILYGDGSSGEFKKGGRYIVDGGVLSQFISIFGHESIDLIEDADKYINLYQGENLNGKKLIGWRSGGSGDISFLTPSFRFLKELYPDCHFTFASGKQYHGLMNNSPYIDKLLAMPIKVDDLEEHDYHIYFQHVIERTEKGRTFNANYVFADHFGFLDEMRKRSENVVDGQPDFKFLKPEIFLSAEIKNFVSYTFRNEFGINKDDLVVGFQLKTSSPVRTWGSNKFIDLAKYFMDQNFKVIFISSPEDKGFIDKIIKVHLGLPVKNDKVFNWANHSKSVEYAAACVSKLSLLIGADSCCIHFAGAFDIPVVGVYGPFPSYQRMMYYKNAVGIDARVKCGPCYLHSSIPCEYTTTSTPCLDLIPSYFVFNGAVDLMNKVYGKEILHKIPENNNISANHIDVL